MGELFNQLSRSNRSHGLFASSPEVMCGIFSIGVELRISCQLTAYRDEVLTKIIASCTFLCSIYSSLYLLPNMMK